MNDDLRQGTRDFDQRPQRVERLNGAVPNEKADAEPFDDR